MITLRRLPRFAALVLLAAAFACAAATPAPPPAPAATPEEEALTPPVLEPLPNVSSRDVELEPQVTIKRRGGETVEEARVAGRVVWIKVTPAHGRPYFLVPTAGGTAYIRRDSLDTGLSVPLWVLFTF